MSLQQVSQNWGPARAEDTACGWGWGARLGSETQNKRSANRRRTWRRKSGTQRPKSRPQVRVTSSEKGEQTAALGPNPMHCCCVRDISQERSCLQGLSLVLGHFCIETAELSGCNRDHGPQSQYCSLCGALQEGCPVPGCQCGFWLKKKVNVKVTQSCLTLCDPMDYTVHGLLQARILELVAFPFSRGSSQPRDRT